MDVAAAMRVGHGLDGLLDVGQQRGGVGAGRHQLAEGQAIHHLERELKTAVWALDDIVDRHDGRVVQRRQDRSFTPQALERLGVTRVTDLQSDVAAEPPVEPSHDASTAAGTELVRFGETRGVLIIKRYGNRVMGQVGIESGRYRVVPARVPVACHERSSRVSPGSR